MSIKLYILSLIAGLSLLILSIIISFFNKFQLLSKIIFISGISIIIIYNIYVITYNIMLYYSFDFSIEMSPYLEDLLKEILND